jgi:membrane fusion protein (multidrug efflux system)
MLRTLLLLVLPAAFAAVALAFYLLSGRYVTTDNAYIGAQKVLITPEVSGKVVRISVVEGQLLAPGDELFEIDPVPYRLAVQEAEARLARVASEFESLKSNLASLAAQLELARDSVATAQADFERKSSLLHDRISTPLEVDRSRVALISAKAQQERLSQQEAAVRIQLRGDPNLSIESYPQYAEASAALDRARRDLANTVLRAPIAGMATQVTSIQMGRYLMAGTAVFSMIATDGVWVDANPKETDLTHLRKGQPATISVDAFPAREWHGTVAAISPGTGAQFAILPPQNAAGNWIKIVQRVPVRIEFDKGQDLRLLRSGMSAYVTIDTGPHTRFGAFAGGTAADDAP